MKLIRNLILAATLLASTALSAHALSLTGFSNTEFTVTYSDFSSTIEGASSLQVIGSDFGDGVYGTLNTPIELGSATDYLLLTGYYTGTSTARFDIQLVDEDGDTLTYVADFISFTQGAPSTVRLDFWSAEGFFNGPVVMVALITSGTGDSVNLTMDHLSAEAVPEPTTWTLLAAAAGMIVLFFRRRKVA